jgi:hypothetical protein
MEQCQQARRVAGVQLSLGRVCHHDGLNPATLYSRMKKPGIRPRGQTEDGTA